MLIVFKTVRMTEKLQSACMKKVLILSLKDECVFMVAGVILNVVTKPA